MNWHLITTDPITVPARRNVIRSFVTDLGKAYSSASGEDLDKAIEGILAVYLSKTQKSTLTKDHLWLKAVLRTLADLASQRWRLKYDKSKLYIQRPDEVTGREGLRERLVARRNQQLREPSVRQFVTGIERWRVSAGKRTSILSLMCDGRDLNRRLADALNGKIGAESVVRPYIQIATSEAVCEHTGLRLIDIWRYFRHTWSNPYESIPGRSMLILVRDSSWPNHPVIGIAALSSAAVRLTARDVFIGWDTEHLIGKMTVEPSERWANWVLKVIEGALKDIYIADFVRDGVVSACPTEAFSDVTLGVLRSIATDQKDIHHRLMEGSDYKSSKQAGVPTHDDWERQSQTPLFRAKRAAELANLLELWRSVGKIYFGKAGVDRLFALTSTLEGRDLLGRVIRVARSKSVGTEIADLTVCGAVAPYNHLAGGKLVAMLAASPEAVLAYQERYRDAQSVIASSMAGRCVTRQANLAFIGTSSLYGKRPNQYDRIAYSCDKVGGKPNEEIKYHYIRDIRAGDPGKGATRGIGTFHLSSETLQALAAYSIAENLGWRVNNVFGEGTSPKMRAIRDGVSAVGLDPDQILTHGIGKCLYGVPLVRNLADYLLGLDDIPDYKFSLASPRKSSQQIASWWFQRWASHRAVREDVLDSIAKETLVYPIRHSARIVMPLEDESQLSLI